MPSEVRFYCVPDYDSVEEVVKKELNSLQLLGKSVLLKVNLMKGQHHSRATNTDPRFVSAVVKCVLEAGGEPLVGDSSGALGLTKAGFHSSGIAEAVEKVGGRWLSFDSAELVPIKCGGLLGKTFIPRQAIESDVRITLPKLKTHPLFGFSGAVKNQLGVLPGALKPELHYRLGGRLDLLARAIVELNLYLPFHYALMDGVIGLEGGGSTTGKAREFGVVAGSSDLVALDSALCDKVGIGRENVLTNIYGETMGLGTMQYEIEGDQFEEKIAQVGFEVKRLPLVGCLAYRLRSKALAVVLENALCNACGRCLDICPADAIEIEEKTVRLRSGRCVLCYVCVENCPKGALKLKPRWYARGAYRKRALGVITE